MPMCTGRGLTNHPPTAMNQAGEDAEAMYYECPVCDNTHRIRKKNEQVFTPSAPRNGDLCRKYAPLIHKQQSQPGCCRGMVTYYNPFKGYGMVSAGPKQYFFHLSYMRTAFTPYQGQKVSFRPGVNERGLQAFDLTSAN